MLVEILLSLVISSTGWKASTEQQLADLGQNSSLDKADVMLAEQYSANKQTLERIREAASSIFEQYLTEQVRCFIKYKYSCSCHFHFIMLIYINI